MYYAYTTIYSCLIIYIYIIHIGEFLDDLRRIFINAIKYNGAHLASDTSGTIVVVVVVVVVVIII